ncbi:MAG: phosphoglycolate phosphatase [Pseudomonadota bacterium]
MAAEAAEPFKLSGSGLSGPGPRGLVFDLDGTLVDSAPDIHAGVTAVLAEDGHAALPFEMVRGFIGGGVAVLMERVMRARGEPACTARRDDMARRFTAMIEAEPGGLTRPYDGAGAALEAVQRAGLRLGICTNKPEAQARGLLAHLGWGAQFGVVVGGDTLAVRKPDPDPLRVAITRMGGGPVLFVGDSEVDCATAEAAGVPFVLFTGGYRTTPVEGLPHLAAFDRWEEFPALIAGLRA